MQALDYPAAHSMDSKWFAIDDAGEVALLSTSENGAVPLHLPSQHNIDALFQYLDSDEHGYAILPIQYDPFADAEHSAELQQGFANLSAQEQAKWQEWAQYSPVELWMAELPDWPICKKYDACSAIVWLESGSDIDFFALGDSDNEKRETVFRLALDRPLYYIDFCHEVTGALVLWLNQRLHAIRFFPFDKRSRLNLGAIHGLYEYDADNHHQFSDEVTRLCPNIYFPSPYRRQPPPAQPRMGMPASALAASTKPDRFDGDKIGPAFVRLPGVRFAQTETVLIDDSVECIDWGAGRLTVNPVKTRIRRNIEIARLASSTVRTNAIAQWQHDALQGDILAQYSLGYLYCESDEPDFGEALHWMEMAARLAESNQIASDDIYENGVAAQYCAGELLYRKWKDVASYDQQEVARMQHWFQLAAERQYTDAQFRLGWMYAKGELLTQDLQQAKQCLQQAAAQDHYRAKALLTELDAIAGAADNKQTQNE